ncbi:MAG: hypothetical protein Q8O55_08495 [Dehalococcoidales bacterium]|nr:hypothetical protein [Dehalococcoidales bacterium]
MRKRFLIPVLSLGLLVALSACVPVWGPSGGGGGMMGGGQGSGMMGGQGGGMMGESQQPSQGQPYSNQPDDQQPYQYGPGGMMGSGMMGSGGMMSAMPMMGGMMGYYSGVPTALSHDDAKDIADGYLASLNNPELEIDEFEEYSHNFYLSLIEKGTGQGAIEIIIDRYSGSYQPEPQSMMWNGKYSMMGGSQQYQMPVTQQQAMEIAQDFLDVAYPDTEASEIIAYYDYYTIMTELDGKHYGMLSVNGYSGEIWYHTWHGKFISEVEEHD